MPRPHPIRVLAYADSPVLGGAESVWLELCRDLARAPGLALTVAAPVENRPLFDGLRRETGLAPVPVIPQRAPLAAFDLRNPVRTALLRRQLRALPHDVLVANLPSMEFGGRALLAAPAGRPAIGVLHIHQSLARAGFRLGAVRDRLARPVARRADVLFAVAPNAAPELAREWGADRARVRHLALPMPPAPAVADREAARHALGLAPDDLAVVLVGRLTMKQKGHDTLLAALPAVVAAEPRVRVLLVGEGPERPLLEERIAAEGLGDRVRLTGWLPEPGAALVAADAVVLPSRFEGLPLVALEAIAARRRGVAAAVDGLAAVWPPEWQVPPGDPAALAARLLEVLRLGEAEAARALDDAAARAAALTTDRPADRLVEAIEALA